MQSPTLAQRHNQIGRHAMPPMLAVDEWISSGKERSASAVIPKAVPEPGSMIGGVYRVMGRLGAGSTGVVLLAHDETLDRPVAIKFTHSDRVGSSFRMRFRDEARAMARISHPNVLQVYAFGEHQDASYIVMEFVAGRTLGQWLSGQRSPPDLDLALRILGDVCAGVAAIHAKNTVHHDLKPSNILLDSRLRPRVADFGLAALWRRDQPSKLEPVGTPAYMAPEIAFSKAEHPALHSRADVYSLACVAYELLTGRPPFDGAGNLGILLQHATRAVLPPSALRPGLPAELDRAVLHALEKDPLLRTASVDLFHRELLAAHRGRSEREQGFRTASEFAAWA
jgi:eukaryotic-like serine/threonine-protein kinase